MRIWRLRITWIRPEPAKIRELVPLTEAQLDFALLNANDEHPIWRSTHQLIKTAEENANANAASSMHPPEVMAGYVGGAQHLRMLRDELNTRRERGRLQFERR